MKMVDDPKDRTIFICLGNGLNGVERSLNTVGQTTANEHQAEEDAQLHLRMHHNLHTIPPFHQTSSREIPEQYDRV